MRKTIYILLYIISYTAYSQSLSVFNIDASGYPNIKADFFAFDTSWKQLTNLSSSDYEVKENGQPRTVTNISCPSKINPQALSSVLVMDATRSMCGISRDIARAGAFLWIDLLPLGKSECAITSYSNDNYINQDFTTDKNKLIKGINTLTCLEGANYNAALIDSTAGGILIANTGKYKKIIIFISDGLPDFNPNTAKIISEANKSNITIYGVMINMPAPQCMKDFANQTGGLFFENIRTKEEAEDCYRKILIIAQGGSPCQIEWQSGITCETGQTNVSLKLIPNNETAIINYQSPNNTVAKLEFNPSSVRFLNAIPGIKADSVITVTAKNADFNVTNITYSNPAYTIAPTNFVLNDGQSRNLTISYLPADSGYTYCKLTVENDVCGTKYYASGGFPGKKPAIQTLKLMHPNGGEVFVVGTDTLITWEGVLPDDKVKIEYSTNNGANWILIADSATGLSYYWLVPKTPSNNCLARVTAKAEYAKSCPDVKICNQIWMGCNLDVEYYRNGDPIPEVTDPTKWDELVNSKTGAWCYYNNDPAMGAIYGKLYNWYAVNDSRGLAPIGWHIPTNAEWTELENCLGGATVAGGKLKTTGTIENGKGLWFMPNTGATNESGFSAVPGGYRRNDLINKWIFGRIGMESYFWYSAEFDAIKAWYRSIYSTSGTIFNGNDSKNYGFSVRCIKD